jgi:type I restriction enzyme S subunit
VVDIVRSTQEASSRISRLQCELLQALKKGASFRRNALADAFSGKLIPQGPTDEPASVLLERIRAKYVESSNNTVARNAAVKRDQR